MSDPRPTTGPAASATDALPVSPMPFVQSWPTPSAPRPIVLIGAGGIANDAHLPSYRRLGLPVAGVFDRDRERARATCARHHLATAFDTLRDAAGVTDAVFDLAIPPDGHRGVLEALPDGAGVLLQKPFGRDLAEATALDELCRRKGLRAAVNFQLRFSPGMLCLREAIAQGLLGAIHDVDVRVNVHTPWELWPFLEALDRVEVALHSIHYLDALRHLVGDPDGVLARTLPHPATPRLANSRSSIILDYGDAVRATITTNHQHLHGPRHQCSQLAIEGAAGAAVFTMGVNLDYPAGRPDTLELAVSDAGWHQVPLRGSWFTAAFEGPMCNLQRHLAGEDPALVSPAADAWRTMALVEACYQADARGSVPVPIR
jgi:predicted dehydrogenase